MKIFRVIAALLILCLITPLVLPLVASGVAKLAGCQMHEGGSSACPILGIEFGDFFAFLAVLPWISFTTLPLAIVLAAVWLVAEIIRGVSRGK